MDKNKLAEEYAHKDTVYKLCDAPAHIGWFNGDGDYCKFCGSYEPRELLVGREANNKEVAAFLAGYDAAESIANAKIQELEAFIVDKPEYRVAEIHALEVKITELEQQLKKADEMLKELDDYASHLCFPIKPEGCTCGLGKIRQYLSRGEKSK